MTTTPLQRLNEFAQRLDNGHIQRVVSKCDDAFYDGFVTDDVEALSQKHIGYMAADALATYLVFVCLFVRLVEGRRRALTPATAPASI